MVDQRRPITWLRRAAALLFAVVALVAAIATPPTDAQPAAGAGAAEIGGRVTFGDGAPADGVAADLFTAQPNGSRDTYVASTVSTDDGSYGFTVDDGCYVIVLIAPDDQAFIDTGRYYQATVCASEGRPDQRVDGMLRTSAATASGRIEYSAGGPVPQVVVDLFHADEDEVRTGYITSTATDEAGEYSLPLPAAGCYVIVMIAPQANTFANRSAYLRTPLCVEAGDAASGIDAFVTSADSAQVGGRVAYESGSGAEGVVVDLFIAAGDGSRGAYLRSTATGLGGRYGFDLAPACYVVVMIAPAGETFAGTGPFHQLDACVADGGVVTTLDGRLAGTAEPPTQLSAVELEIARLTNELRADPSGPLARRKPMPPCVEEGFYDITVDARTGHPQPALPLEVSELVSVEMARSWAAEMQRRGQFIHRPSASQQRIYDRLGINVSAWGENIAWSSGYPPEQAARIHFEGWRESETGHYCSLVTGRFTSFGVGEHHLGGESWAVQNFYAQRR